VNPESVKEVSMPIPIWQGTPLRVRTPKVRDPFVNTNLISLGAGMDGEERFWISTWNSMVGTLAALVTETGKTRMYRFGKHHAGFYSAAQEDADTLWLCGGLSHVVRLTLSTGKFEVFPTGAPYALVFQGMVFDPVTGKLFVAAFPYTSTTAFSFDTRTRQTAQIYDHLAPDYYMRFHFPNGDGSYSCLLHVPGETIVRWDPQTETTEAWQYHTEADCENMSDGTFYHLINDDAGRWYFPGRGWYDPCRRLFAKDGPRPQQEMTWFARRGMQAWGCNTEEAITSVGIWDMTTGAVRHVCRIPDASLSSVNLSQAGKIVAVDMKGIFSRFDGESGELELSKKLPSDSYGQVDCLCRIDEERLLGTPFITQRFWEVNLRTGKGMDCGRAAPGAGEVLLTWKIGHKVYMAAYTGGELVEYDPAEHAHFPENPRVVADPPHGMRPVAAADDGRTIYYSCSVEYGHLGSVLTKYDTRTGIARYHQHPLPDQQIRSLCFDRPTRTLLCGTTIHADCQSCPPRADRCYLALIDADTLHVLAQAAAPEGASWANVVGPLSRGCYLCTCDGPEGARWFVMEVADFQMPEYGTMHEQPPGTRNISYAGTPGLFVLHIKDRFEVWDMRTQRLRLRLCRNPRAHRYFVQDDAFYLVDGIHVVVLDPLGLKIRRAKT